MTTDRGRGFHFIQLLLVDDPAQFTYSIISPDSNHSILGSVPDNLMFSFGNYEICPSDESMLRLGFCSKNEGVPCISFYHIVVKFCRSLCWLFIHVSYFGLT